MEALILSLARNHLRRQRPLRIMIHQDESHPSHLELPITRGNIIGTFFSGGESARSGRAANRLLKTGSECFETLSMNGRLSMLSNLLRSS